MAGVVGKHPDLLYAPLEIKGDAEVHALSRCQMILTEAKKRAQREFDEALERHGPHDRGGARLRGRPAPRCGWRPTASRGQGVAAGTAANLVLHVAELMGRGERLARPGRAAEARTARARRPRPRWRS